METISLHELHKICRICLKSDILASIYSPTFLIRPIEMLQKLQIFKADDGLPSLLCQSCLYRVLDAYNLQQLAEASERRLKEYFGLTSASCSVVSNLAADVSVTPIMPSHSTTPTIDLIKPEGECSSSSMYANICDMMFDRHDVTNDMVEVVGGTDDVELLNDVEIDVSSLTRSEADENTLGDVFATKSRLTLETSFVNNRLNGSFKLQDHNSQLPMFDGPMENKIADLSLRIRKKTSSIKALRKSLKTPDECMECGKIFPYKGYLEIHKRVHSGEKPFKCQICPREFITSTKLLLHQRTSHNNIIFDDKFSLSSTERKRFQCEICSAFFATSSNLKSHKFTHSDKRNYPCQHCPVSFKSPRDLKRHEPMHKTIRDIFCGICEKSFTKRTSLNAHMITVHRRIRKHECSECDKVFGKKSNLINHLRIHSGEKPFQCPSCSWKFAQSSALRRHMKKHETKSFPLNVSTTK